MTAFVIYQADILDSTKYEEYTAIRKLRDGAARATLYIVDGIEDAG